MFKISIDVQNINRHYVIALEKRKSLTHNRVRSFEEKGINFKQKNEKKKRIKRN